MDGEPENEQYGGQDGPGVERVLGAGGPARHLRVLGAQERVAQTVVRGQPPCLVHLYQAGQQQLGRRGTVGTVTDEPQYGQYDVHPCRARQRHS
ncbi:hypothetical protein [Streptomyces sp. A30]|uniref:hypothetical protein n=1 Tax=Streptomyces sp. A30 TaxID=2789273 RepID=UPI00397F7148